MKCQPVTSLIIVIAISGILSGCLLALLLTSLLEQTQLMMAGVIVVFLLLSVAFVVGPLLKDYFSAPDRLIEDIQVMITANPAHRASALETPGNLKPMAEAINSLGQQYQQTLESQATQIEQARARLADEKNKLAVLIEYLSEGIVVCNMQGRILLYNNQATQLLEHKVDETPGDIKIGFVGLGRSIFGLMDRNIIVTATESITHHYEKNGAYPQVIRLVIVAANGLQLRVRLIPMITRQEETLNGFILSLEDVSQMGKTSRHQFRQIDTMVKTVRTSLVNIQSLVEKLKQLPAMEADPQSHLEAIHTETTHLNTLLGQSTEEYSAQLNLYDWRMEEILSSDLLWNIRQYAETELEIELSIENQDEPVWLRNDKNVLVQVTTHIMRQLKNELEIKQATLRLSSFEQMAALEVAWTGETAPQKTLQKWQNEEFSTSVTAVPISVSLIASVHGGQVQWNSDKATNRNNFKLLLPTIEPQASKPMQLVHGNRPEFYDFDLFRQTDLTQEMDQRHLSELIYTVFDTETTGLRPAEGDEITSISAVRIVNGRVLYQETFDHLVDPKRSLPQKSIDITGITPDMVSGQPTIEQILPKFHAFAEDTVLVAHNAAFDMRCLEVKENQTNLKFNHPVVDTLLLSAVLYPNYDNHGLDAIAERFGLTNIGRHSSLGDSIVTAEILLKLMPLLEKKGIVTLGQAQQTAQETYLARLKY